MANLENHINVPLRRLEDVTLTVHVEVTKKWRLRLWLATQLIRLAGWILGSRVEIDR